MPHPSQPARLFRHLAPQRTGDPSDRDPAEEFPGLAPNLGQDALPHVITFQGVLRSIAKTYYPSDEALRDSLDNSVRMRSDTGILECLEQRKRSTALLGWHLEPESEQSPSQKRICEELTAIIRRIPDFLKYRECLLEALWYGKYGVQQRFRYQKVRGRMRHVVDRWQPVNGDKIVFRIDDGSGEWNPDQVGIRVGYGYSEGQTLFGRWKVERVGKVGATHQGMAYFLEEWERPMLALHKHIVEDGEFELPERAGRIHGVGIRDRIYWTWYMQTEALGWLMEFLERSALPFEMWSYPEGNPAAKEKTIQAAKERIGNNRNVVIVPRHPDSDFLSSDVKVIDFNMAGAQVLKDILIDYFGHRLKRYILGQTLTSEAAGTGLGSNLASIHLDTYLQIVRYDAINLGESLTRELVRPLLRYNFPGWADCQVRFVIDTESPDIEGKLAAWERAYNMGLRIPARDVANLIGVVPPEEGEEYLQKAEARQQQQQGSGFGGRQEGSGFALPGSVAQGDQRGVFPAAAVEGAAGAAESASYAKRYDPRQPRDRLGRWAPIGTHKTIGSLVQDVLSTAKGPKDRWIGYRKVGAVEARRLKRRAKINARGYYHVLAESEIRHMLKRHGRNGSGLTANQIPLTEEDFELIPQIVAAPDAIVPAKDPVGKNKLAGLWYEKRLDGYWLYLEEVRSGEHRLAAKTLMKFKRRQIKGQGLEQYAAAADPRNLRPETGRPGAGGHDASEAAARKPASNEASGEVSGSPPANGPSGGIIGPDEPEVNRQSAERSQTEPYRKPWDERKHPRGQPDNAGQFAKKDQASGFRVQQEKDQGSIGPSPNPEPRTLTPSPPHPFTPSSSLAAFRTSVQGKTVQNADSGLAVQMPSRWLDALTRVVLVGGAMWAARRGRFALAAAVLTALPDFLAQARYDGNRVAPGGEGPTLHQFSGPIKLHGRRANLQVLAQSGPDPEGPLAFRVARLRYQGSERPRPARPGPKAEPPTLNPESSPPHPLTPSPPQPLLDEPRGGGADWEKDPEAIRRAWERKSVSSKTEFGRAVLETASAYDIPPEDLKEAVDFVLEGRQDVIRDREAAKASIRKRLGLTAGDLARLENAGYDYTAAPEKIGGETAKKLRDFDSYATAIASEYPELALGDPERGDDVAANLWNLIREGAQRVPQPHDPEILREAAELVQRDREEEKKFADGGGWFDDEGGAPVAIGAEAGEEEEYIPFRRAGHLSPIGDTGQVERYRQWRTVVPYARHRSAAGQAVFEWDEEKHPRGAKGTPEAGQFVEKEPGQKQHAQSQSRRRRGKPNPRQDLYEVRDETGKVLDTRWITPEEADEANRAMRAAGKGTQWHRFASPQQATFQAGQSPAARTKQEIQAEMRETVGRHLEGMLTMIQRRMARGQAFSIRSYPKWIRLTDPDSVRINTTEDGLEYAVGGQWLPVPRDTIDGWAETLHIRPLHGPRGMKTEFWRRIEAAPDAETERPQRYAARFDPEKHPHDELGRWARKDALATSVEAAGEALEQVIATRTDVPNAVRRSDIGWIGFPWGEAGDPAKQYQGGYGVAHILARHGTEAVKAMPETLVRGKITRRYGPPQGERVDITHGAATAVVSLFWFGKRAVWLLTGWKS